MDEEKDLAQRKKEAAERAKQLARERLAAKRAAEQAQPAAEQGRRPTDETNADAAPPAGPIKEAQEPEPPASAEDLASAKKRAAEEARARAAELRRQREAAATGAGTGDDLEAAKRKAAEEARARAAELRRQREAATGAGARDDLEAAKRKAAEEARARAAELRGQREAATGAGTGDDLEAAKRKAAEEERARAAELRRQREAANDGAADEDLELAKKKAAAAAKARAAAMAKQQGDVADDAAKQKAAAAARAKAKATGADGGMEQPPASSPNDPLLDHYVRLIREHLGPDVLEDAYINRLAKDVPTLVVKKEAYYKVAELLKSHEQLRFDYLSELHGTDYKTHMEVYVHLYSYSNRQPVALKVKIERDNPEIDSLVPLWPGANWPECEAYDLLGIRFRGHPNLIRIFLGEQWVGHPLRKDYEPYDAEV
ncbi:NADH-quinone oxidoreductase subunit C [Geobacillus sp. C56-T2]|uniref:NADH-quinone oxidoreductase subunit C n=1 Tax=Geobacillus sp. C56-T2 TaxID=600773 RepID=UPI0011AA4D6F|nr:NADH-quinone oxidoreductase subunit C [Geobacillus sp. C56-T2]NNV07712.1 NADH-quinone oxidoreductase subunit C [Geobacillus sp. MMMUD3]TWG32051.1 NADH dehydrogenase subunit C [Geobacillus sp. C56-T2]